MEISLFVIKVHCASKIGNSEESLNTERFFAHETNNFIVTVEYVYLKKSSGRFYVFFPAFHRLRRAASVYIYNYARVSKPNLLLKQRSN